MHKIRQPGSPRPRVPVSPRRAPRRIEQPRILPPHLVAILVGCIGKAIAQIAGHRIEAEGRARSLSLDLVAQWKGLESDGQFRFTPPTHVSLAFRQALDELDDEGGVSGRAARYRANQDALMSGMSELGFDPYLLPEYQSHIITSFRYPAHPNFDFNGFYARLSERGFVIYPGKVSGADCFRIGTIWHIFPAGLYDS